METRGDGQGQLIHKERAKTRRASDLVHTSWGLRRKERSQDKCVSYELGKVNMKWGCRWLEFTLGLSEDFKTSYKESMVEEWQAEGEKNWKEGVTA